MKRKNIFSKTSKSPQAQDNRLTKNERLTLILSVSAILVSVGQLIFNSQFFTDIFIKPQLYASAKDYNVKDERMISIFRVENKGNKTAEDLTISFTCYKDDSYTIVPGNIFEVTEKQNGVPLKDVIIKSPSFVPNDLILIVVETDTINFNRLNKQLASQKVSPNNFMIPNLNFVKYKDKFASIDRYIKE